MAIAAKATEAAFTNVQRRLAAIAKDTEKELTAELRKVGNEARDVVRSSTEAPYRTGKTRKSVRLSVRRKTVLSLYSNSPQSPVWEFGGVIRPKGKPIEIPQTNFIRGTVVAIADEIDEKLADAFDRIARRNGFT